MARTVIVPDLIRLTPELCRLQGSLSSENAVERLMLGDELGRVLLFKALPKRTGQAKYTQFQLHTGKCHFISTSIGPDILRVSD